MKYNVLLNLSVGMDSDHSSCMSFLSYVCCNPNNPISVRIFFPDPGSNYWYAERMSMPLPSPDELGIKIELGPVQNDLKDNQLWYFDKGMSDHSSCKILWTGHCRIF